jgi:hypothetical protein
MLNREGYWAPLHGPEAEEYELMHAYEMGDGKPYIFLGPISEGAGPGLYQNEDESMSYVQYPDDEGEQYYVEERGPLTREEEILNGTLRMLMMGGPVSVRPMKVHRDSSGTTRRVPAEEDGPPIEFEFGDDDDDVVRMIKEHVNARLITLEEFYSHFDNRNSGYNVLYGLRTRPTITYPYVCRWAEILGMDVDIRFLPRKRKRE